MGTAFGRDIGPGIGPDVVSVLRSVRLPITWIYSAPLGALGDCDVRPWRR